MKYSELEPGDTVPLPCPFCGSRDVDVVDCTKDLSDGTEWRGLQAECDGCAAAMPLDRYESVAVAMAQVRASLVCRRTRA